MKIPEEVKRWFESAKADLIKAKDNFNLGHYDLTSFLCQQSVEKSLKSIVMYQTKSFPKIHDLIRLGRLSKIEPEILKECEKLNYVYTETRYPDTSNRKFTKKESEEDIKSAELILKWAEKKLY